MCGPSRRPDDMLALSHGLQEGDEIAITITQFGPSTTQFVHDPFLDFLDDRDHIRGVVLLGRNQMLSTGQGQHISVISVPSRHLRTVADQPSFRNEIINRRLHYQTGQSYIGPEALNENRELMRHLVNVHMIRHCILNKSTTSLPLVTFPEIARIWPEYLFAVPASTLPCGA